MEQRRARKPFPNGVFTIKTPIYSNLVFMSGLPAIFHIMLLYKIFQFPIPNSQFPVDSVPIGASETAEKREAPPSSFRAISPPLNRAIKYLI